MKIAGRSVNHHELPVVVAEMSANHNGNIETAKRVIAAAKRGGADAIKFQAYNAGALADARGGRDVTIDSGPWAGRTLGDLYGEAETPIEWFPALIREAEACGIDWFSSVFDMKTLEVLEVLDCPIYKISSFDTKNLALIQAVAETGKPVVISTGMATDADIGAAVNMMARYGTTQNLVLLHCVSAYPTPANQSNLQRIPHLRRRFGVPVGYSDHTRGFAAAIAAVAMGACMIEKHVTVTPGEGPDGAFSVDEETLSRITSGAVVAYCACQNQENPVEPYGHLRVVS